jgi:hypothetical protein
MYVMYFCIIHTLHTKSSFIHFFGRDFKLHRVGQAFFQTRKTASKADQTLLMMNHNRMTNHLALTQRGYLGGTMKHLHKLEALETLLRIIQLIYDLVIEFLKNVL